MRDLPRFIVREIARLGRGHTYSAIDQSGRAMAWSEIRALQPTARWGVRLPGI
jgi:hypothetical protein